MVTGAGGLYPSELCGLNWFSKSFEMKDTIDICLSESISGRHYGGIA
jgi:hypothetical protein